MLVMIVVVVVARWLCVRQESASCWLMWRLSCCMRRSWSEDVVFVMWKRLRQAVWQCWHGVISWEVGCPHVRDRDADASPEMSDKQFVLEGSVVDHLELGSYHAEEGGGAFRRRGTPGGVLLGSVRPGREVARV